MRVYRYVGPEESRVRALENIRRTRVEDLAGVRAWMAEAEPDRRRREYVPATFVVDVESQLWVADRRSEHVACGESPRFKGPKSKVGRSV